MTTIVTRAGKGSPLTHAEVDTNFTNLNTAKLEAGAIALGSAALPSISFTGDTNTGIFSPGADQVAISTNGSERLRITSAGLVGIGTSTPTDLLTVAATTPGIDWTYAINTAFKHSIVATNYSSSASSNSLVFKVASGSGTQATVMHLNGAGQVGIGTTSPAQLLHVKSSSLYGVITADNSSSTGGGLFSAYQNGTQKAIFGVSGAIEANTSSDAGIFADTIGGGIRFYVNGSPAEKARIDSSGRFLVGTTSASGNNLLQVNSDALIYSLTVGRGAGAISTNTAVGNSALAANTTGVQNTANGYQALYSNTTGIYNTANGYVALYNNTTGDYNTANGRVALYANTTGSSNTANGLESLTSNTTGSSNTATGFQALYANTTGSNNTANGYEALRANTTGIYNTANGHQALFSNTTGVNNTANGLQALYANTTGSHNTATGYQALFSNTTGVNNTANGYQALYSNTTGYYNTANGRDALHYNTTGNGNVCIGSLNSAGSYAPVFNCTTENNRVVMSSTSVTNAYIQVAWTVVSDARDKTNFGMVPHGLEFVKQLNPVSFQFKETRDATEPHGPVRYGFKAQDILALEGEDNAVIIDNEDPDKLRYNGEALVPVLVNAIKEQQALIDAQQAQIDALLARLDAAGI